MPVPEPFYFGIPLIARAAARDWGAVESLFATTLQSVLSQTDGHFHVVLAAHDLPAAWQELGRKDDRLSFLHAPWAVEPPSSANDDGGAKKWLIRQHVLERGGGLLMFVDGDDLVDRRTVELSRALIHDGGISGLVSHGVAIDAASGNALEFRMPVRSTRRSIAFADRRRWPGSPPHQLDPYELLGSHHCWEDRAKAEELELIHLPTSGGYLVNTGQNHSETQGPFSAWRQQFSHAVMTRGRPLSAALRERLGIGETCKPPARSGVYPVSQG